MLYPIPRFFPSQIQDIAYSLVILFQITISLLQYTEWIEYAMWNRLSAISTFFSMHVLKSVLFPIFA